MGKNTRVVLGIDNGVTGSICLIKESGDLKCRPTPTREKFPWKRACVSSIDKYRRLDFKTFFDFLTENIHCDEIIVYLERPMLQGGVRFNSSVSAAMCHADTTMALEMFAKAIGAKLTINVIDSKKWQSALKKYVPGERNTKEMAKYFAESILNIFDVVPDHDAVCIAYYGAMKSGIASIPKQPKQRKKR